jgi:hypothetical protein
MRYIGFQEMSTPILQFDKNTPKFQILPPIQTNNIPHGQATLTHNTAWTGHTDESTTTSRRNKHTTS